MNAHDDFELKRMFDELPREIEPGGRDLWPDIRTRLDSRASLGMIDWRGRQLRIAALLITLAASAGALASSRRAAAQWHLLADNGESRLFTVGEALATGSRPARLTVGRIGTVDVAEGTAVQILAARHSEHRLALTLGSIHARIDAPPRLFTVETPSGTAVDLGCEYTLDVDSLGTSTLVVKSGWVAFEDRGLESLIPAGMRVITRRGRPVGTPFRDDAPDALRAAIAVFDSGVRGDSVVGTLVQSARVSDAVTLWHVAGRTEGEPRRLVFTRLFELVPPPSGVTRDAVMNDSRMMKLYWASLPGGVPVASGWQETIWRLWYRVAG